MFERYTMEKSAAAEVDEEAAIIFVDGKEEGAIGGDGDAGDVGGGLNRESCGLGFAEVGDGDTVADGREEESVIGDDGVAATVWCSEKVLESEVHFALTASPCVVVF